MKSKATARVGEHNTRKHYRDHGVKFNAFLSTVPKLNSSRYSRLRGDRNRKYISNIRLLLPLLLPPEEFNLVSRFNKLLQIYDFIYVYTAFSISS
jgi:hypothetical protein